MGFSFFRQGIHNHLPQADPPLPLSGQLPSMEAPTFEQVAATVQPFRRQCKREFKTHVTFLDTDSQQIVQ